MNRALSKRQHQSIAESTQRVNIWHGAIRSGKTFASLLRWLGYVASAPRGGELVVIGRTRDSIARNVFAPLQDPALFGRFASQVRYTPGAASGTIFGRKVHVIGASDVKAEKTIRGLTCAGAYVDELTVISLEFFAQLLGRLSVDDSKLFGTTNPDNPAHWLKADYLDRLDQLPDWSAWHFVLDDNPVLPEHIKDSYRREQVGLFYRRFVLGEWVAAEGAIYDMWDPDRHVVAELPPIANTVGIGVDYGTTNPFAGVELAVGADGILYITREWGYDSRITHRQLTDAEYSARLRGWIGERTPPWVVVDPSATSFVTQLHRDGYTPALADNAVIPGIRNVASLLALGQLKVHSSCTGLIQEVTGYSWDDTAAHKGEDRPVKARDHYLDGLRYIVHTTDAIWRPQLREATHAPA